MGFVRAADGIGDGASFFEEQGDLWAMGDNDRGDAEGAGTVEVPEIQPVFRRSFHKWRVFSLSMVYVVFAAHIIHWKITGTTLAPLELNEVMYTLELGIVTAGFLFMCALVLCSRFVGRFFCSWACHIMVLQDLCAWILRRLGVRQKPIRSRLLLWVPPLTAFYMFLWPQVVRTWQARAFPEFHLRSDVEGWASFATDNFWRNLPNAPIIVLTFLVCGFLIVYLLGSRSFCTYVCPYGAIFAVADRFARGRVRGDRDKCQQCGTCTAACTCGIRVHEEVKMHGMIVNPACLKDLDCVSVCPQGALSYGPTKMALFKSFKSGGRFGSLPYDFSPAEDVLMGLVFLTVLLSFRGLYSRIPFLLSLALGAIIAFLTIQALRLFFRPDVAFATIRAKTNGWVTASGRVFAVFFILLTVLVAHSAFVRYHEYFGLRQARAFRKALGTERADDLAERACDNLAVADRWGLIANPRVEMGLSDAAFHLKRFGAVETFARRLLERNPYDSAVRLRLGQALAGRNDVTAAARQFRAILGQWQGAEDEAPAALAGAHQAMGGLFVQRGDFASAAAHLRACVGLSPDRAEAQAELGAVLAELGQLEEATTALRKALRLKPDLGDALFSLGAILARLGQLDDAVTAYRSALEISPDDADTHTNLGIALLQTRNLTDARQHLERAVSINPNHALAHFGLGELFTLQGSGDLAARHYQTATRLDPRFKELLESSQSD